MTLQLPFILLLHVPHRPSPLHLPARRLGELRMLKRKTLQLPVLIWRCCRHIWRYNLWPPLLCSCSSLARAARRENEMDGGWRWRKMGTSSSAGMMEWGEERGDRRYKQVNAGLVPWFRQAEPRQFVVFVLYSDSRVVQQTNPKFEEFFSILLSFAQIYQQICHKYKLINSSSPCNSLCLCTETCLSADRQLVGSRCFWRHRCSGGWWCQATWPGAFIIIYLVKKRDGVAN